MALPKNDPNISKLLAMKQIHPFPMGHEKQKENPQISRIGETQTTWLALTPTYIWVDNIGYSVFSYIYICVYIYVFFQNIT